MKSARISAREILEEVTAIRKNLSPAKVSAGESVPLIYLVVTKCFAI